MTVFFFFFPLEMLTLGEMLYEKGGKEIRQMYLKMMLTRNE